MGHEVFVFNHERENWRQKIHQKTHRSSFIRSKNLALLKRVDEDKPDVFFSIYGTPFFPETIEILKKKGIKTICWWLNDPFEIGTRCAPLHCYDNVYSNSALTSSQYKESGVNQSFMPVGIFPSVHKPIETPKKYDLLFAGDHAPVREELLLNLVSKGFRPAIFGPWRERVVKKYDVLKPYIMKRGFFSPDEMSLLFNQSKIVINLHTWFGRFNYGVNPRLTEAAGCRSFQLVDHKEEIEQLFDLNTEMATFRSLDGFADRALYYLNETGEREKMAHAAWERSMDEHTYRHRLEKIL